MTTIAKHLLGGWGAIVLPAENQKTRRKTNHGSFISYFIFLLSSLSTPSNVQLPLLKHKLSPCFPSFLKLILSYEHDHILAIPM